METTKRNINWPAIALLIVIAFLCFVVFQSRENETRLQSNSKIDQQQIKTLKNANGTLTASVVAEQLTASEWKIEYAVKDKLLQETTKRFAKLSSITTAVAKAKIDSVNVVFDQPIVCETTNPDGTKSNGFQRSGDLQKDWFSTNYKVNQNGLQFTNLTATIETTTITGFKRKWFFGKQTAATDVTPSMPGITIVQVQSTEIVVPVRFYETKLFLIGTGFLLKAASQNIKF